MKKFWISILSLIIVLSLTVGCSDKKESTVSTQPDENFNKTGFPIVDKPITLTMMGMSSPLQPSWDKMNFFKFMEEKTNIKFKFKMSTSEDYQQKKQLAFGSNELPDLFFAANLTPGEEAEYGSQGMLIPLEGLIDKYAPNLKKLMAEHPEIKPSITSPDGHIYSLPAYDDTIRNYIPLTWMDGDFLKAVGAKRPSTIDEFYNLLVKFKNEDPNGNGKADEIPISAPDLATLRNALFPDFGIVQSNGIYEENGKIKYAFTSNNYKVLLEFLHKLYKEKLMDQQIFSHTWDQYVAKGAEKRVGVYPTWPIVMVGFKDPSEAANYPLLPPMTSSVNDKKLVQATSKVYRGRAAITSANKHPAATMRWLDYLYSPEGSIQVQFGLENKDWKWTDDSKSKWVLTPPKGMNTTQASAQAAPGSTSPTPYVIRTDFMSKEDNPTIHLIEKWISDELVPYAKLPLPDVHYTTEEQDQINQLQPDIDKYIEQMEAKFVKGDESFNNWDKFVKTLNNLGVDKLVKINQAAYDRYEKAAK
ncbi:extracellular solute-binding protein [Tuberibacillus calidus]|jgi:putative aldouronate transport system substrate-binding protein|uniref:extracellular solute-binding protein n=1 Tax=Tuberibacillus calidus TaxID=340097 RepID=UPI0004289EE9|nr:extracellular solute-binding protein [Tuberibacillus calidus]